MAEKKFEDAIQRLEEIVDKMESGDLSLDESLRYYEEGIKLTRACYKKLTEAEKKIEKLIKKQDGQQKKGFETQALDLFTENGAEGES